MDWEVIAPMIVGIVLILTVGGVAVLRPIAKRLGVLLEAVVQQKAALPAEEIRHLRDTVETMSQRMALMEERQDFTERLIGRGDSGKAERAEE